MKNPSQVFTKGEINSIILTFLLSLSILQNSFAQTTWAVRFSGSYSLYNCSSTQVTIQVSFANASDQTTFIASSSGNFPTIDLSGTGAPTGTLSIVAHGYCNFIDGLHVDDSRTFSFNNLGCQQTTTYSSSESGGFVGLLTATLQFYPPMQVSVDLTNECNNDIKLTSACAALASYIWEVTDDPSIMSPRIKVISTTSINQINVTADDLHSVSFMNDKYSHRWVRVNDTGIVGQRTGAWNQTRPKVPSPIVTASGIVPTCYNGADGSLVVNISPLSPVSDVNRHLQKIHPNGIIENIFQDQHSVPPAAFPPTNLSAGTYRLIVTNNTLTTEYGSCLTTVSNIVLDNPDEVIIQSYVFDAVKCKGGDTGKISITSVAGGTGSGYTFTMNGSPASGEVSGLTTGDYIFRAFDSYGCPSTKVTIAVGEPVNEIIATIANEDYRGFGVKCPNSSDGIITAAVSHHVGSVNYHWYSGSTIINGETGSILNNRAPGTYSVVVTDTNGCTSTSNSLALIAPPQIDFSIVESGTIICPGDNSKTLEAQLVPGTLFGDPIFEWSPDEENDQIIFNKGAADYSLTVTDSEGCSLTKSMLIKRHSTTYSVYRCNFRFSWQQDQLLWRFKWRDQGYCQRSEQ